jgi:pseudouridine-5'-phosphate glycosidase/pseudouridine kinase
MYPTKVRKRPVIVGGTVVDVTAKANVGKDDVMSTSSPGTISKSLGGVGRNVAEACHRAGGDPLFITAIGDDLDGHSILEKLKEFKMDVQGIELVPNETTAVYNAMLHQDGELIAAVADMRMHSLMKSKHFENVIDQVEPSIICTDGNIEYEYLEYISKYCIENNVPLLFEPTSVFKSMKVYQLNPELLKAVKYITPDAFEAKKMRDFYYSLGLKSQLQNHEIHYINGLESESESMLTLLNVFDHVILKCGWRGVLVGSSDGIQGIPVGNKRWSITHLEPNNADDVVSVTGAGDTLVGVLVAGISKREAVTHKELVQIVKKGMNAAELTIQSSLAVSPLITSDILE